MRAGAVGVQVETACVCVGGGGSSSEPDRWAGRFQVAVLDTDTINSVVNPTGLTDSGIYHD